MHVTHTYPLNYESRLLDKASIGQKERESKWSAWSASEVEEVKSVVRMLPIWGTTIIFWTVYAQVVTFSVSQAATMDRHVIGTFRIPAASLTVFFVASILVTVPVYDRLVVPATSALLGTPGGPTPLQRIGVGLVLSIFAMVAAALTELRRISAPATDKPSVFWLVPQFLLVGSGEAFTYIGQLDFFLRECPKGMKTMSTGLFLSTLSLGFFVSSFLVVVVHKVTGDNHAWLTDDLDKGKLYNFYWLLAVLSALNLAVYLLFAHYYVYKDDRLVSDDHDDQRLKQINVVSNN